MKLEDVAKKEIFTQEDKNAVNNLIALGYKYVARDRCDGAMFAYKNKPILRGLYWSMQDDALRIGLFTLECLKETYRYYILEDIKKEMESKQWKKTII